jgi:hypothetical protein
LKDSVDWGKFISAKGRARRAKWDFGSGGGSDDYELLTLAEIIQKTNDVFGSDLGEEEQGIT